MFEEDPSLSFFCTQWVHLFNNSLSDLRYCQTKLTMEMSTKEEERPIWATPMCKNQEVKHQKQLVKQATVGAEFCCLS
ncbi:hypothetical protein CHARACLAT_025325 [Characodon lateralis]|uniref:Uncharacterized protein n=1 Tax=Characodon lateralis TaxID=208331 RepID=A0ABU7ED12_9TELE|nr:hypothetical protein [Characodon lateralis]